MRIRYSVVLLFCFCIFCGFSSAANISVNEVNSAYTSCKEDQSIDINYYLDGDSLSKNPQDSYSNNDYGVIPYTPSNEIEIWKNNGVLSSCNTWKLESNFIPKSSSTNKYAIFQNTDGCTFKKPSTTRVGNIDRIDAQIHFKFVFFYEWPNEDSSTKKTKPASWQYRKEGESFYRCGDTGDPKTQGVACPSSSKIYKDQLYSHVGECINYRIYWCGDGVLNGRNWSTSYDNGTYIEKCDPKDPNEIGWGDGGCSDSCEPIENLKVKPECGTISTEYNSSFPTARITTSTSGLCKVGTLKSGSLKGPNDATIGKGKYEWYCENDGYETEACTTSDEYCGDGDKNGDEACDGTDGAGPYGCSATCTQNDKPKVKPECGTIAKEYNSSFPTARITTSTPGLCKVGTLKSGSLKGPNDAAIGKGKYEWYCENDGYETEACTTSDEYCGDGDKNGDEACDGTDGAGPYGCSATCTQNEASIVPAISKKVVGSTTGYYKGDLITFRINFKNDKDKRIDGIVIKDFLPLNVEYKSSEIFGISPKPTLTDYSIYEDQKILDHDFKKGQKVVETSPFSLDPGKSGYILLTGEVLGSNTDNRINVACEYVDKTVICTNGVQYDLGGRSFKATKKVEGSKKVFSIGKSFTYNIHVESVEGKYEKLEIRDRLPKGLKFVSGTEELDGVNVELHEPIIRSDGGETVVWNLEFPDGFKTYNGKSDSFDLKITVKILGDDNRYTNLALICKDEYQKDDDCEPIYSDDVEVSDNSGLSIKKYVGRSVNVKNPWVDDDTMQFNIGDTVYFKIIVTATGGKYKGFTVKDPLGSNLDFLSFESASIDGVDSSDYEIKTDDGDILKWDVTIKDDSYFEKGDQLVIVFSAIMNAETKNTAYVYKGETLLDEDSASVGKPTPPLPPEPRCGDGKQNAGIEFCDLGGESIVKDGKLFLYEEGVNMDYNGWTCTKDCQLIKGLDSPSCSNVQNGSISIMTGEMLPFYRNIQGMLKTKSISEKEKYLNNNFFNGSTCSEEDYMKAKINLDSMMCHFTVYGPNTKEGLDYMDNIVYSFNIPCVRINGWGAGGYSNTEYYSGITDFIKQNENGWFNGSVGYNGSSDDARNVFKTLDNWQDYPSLFPVSSKVIITNFGQTDSKLIGNNGVEMPLDLNTSHLPVSLYGEYKISLDEITFKRCAWKGWDPEEGNLFEISDNEQSLEQICSVNFTVTDHYFVQKSPYGTINDDSKKSLANYRQKNGTHLFKMDDNDEKDTDYGVEQQVFDNYNTFISKYSKIAKPISSSDRIRKVAGKDLYLIDGTEEFVLPSSELNLDSSFTLIATSGADIRITNNIYVNMMLITEGRIIFDAINACNPDREGKVVKYGKAGQMVQGIFYAGSGYLSINDTYNERNSVAHKPKYDIWCNYGNLHIKGVVVGKLDKVIQKRRSELYTWFSAGSDKEKRDVVLNGASVQVEYNPNLLGKLPPGAEEFNKLLKTQRE